MASTVRAPSQIDSRVKFLIALTSTDYYVPDEGGVIKAVMTQQEFDDNTNNGFIGAASTVYRDMGKSVTIVNASTGLHKAMYRLVQRVNGPASEGVSGNEYDQFYIRLWAADPSSEPVTVARVG